MEYPRLAPLPAQPPRPSIPAATLELRGCLSEVKNELRLEQQRRRRLEQRENTNYGLPAAAIRAVLAAYVLSGYKASLAGMLASRLTCLKCPTAVDTNWDKVAEDIFFACTYDEIAAVHAPDSKPAVQAVEAARRFLSEYDLVGWVRAENAKGFAPSSSSSVAYREHLRGIRLNEEQVIFPSRKVRKWVQRWRRRWAVRRGQLRRAEPLPPGLVCLKASQICWCVFGENCDKPRPWF